MSEADQDQDMLDRAEVFRGQELEELNWSEIWESGIVEDHVSELTSDTSDTYYSDKLTVLVDSGESESEFFPQFSSTPHR